MSAPKLYLDEDIGKVVALILAARKFDVLRTQDAGNLGKSDEQQLEFAASTRRCLVSHNIKHFVQWHAWSLGEGRDHAGILLIPHDPRPSIVAAKILKRLADETSESVAKNLLFG